MNEGLTGGVKGEQGQSVPRAVSGACWDLELTVYFRSPHASDSGAETNEDQPNNDLNKEYLCTSISS